MINTERSSKEKKLVTSIFSFLLAMFPKVSLLSAIEKNWVFFGKGIHTEDQMVNYNRYYIEWHTALCSALCSVC